VQYVINNTHHASLRASPSKLLLGIELRNNIDAKLIDFLNKIAKNDLDFEKDRDSCRDLAVEATEMIKKYNKTYYDKKHRKPSKYNIGDLVLIKDSALKAGEDKKLKSEYKGPYQIAKILDKNRYVVKDVPGFNITAKPYNSVLSTDCIKPWIKPIPCT